VEPACAVLEIAPSTYYAAKKREENPSARDERDEEMKEKIMRVWSGKGRKAYGARKVWRELRREGIDVARCTVERLMRELGIAGIAARKKRPRTTVPGPAGQVRPSDLLERDFTAPAPNRRWVADITYIETGNGFVYAAFILDLFSRMIVGWQVSDTLRAELALDALEMAIWSRGDRIGGDLVHHSDRGVQYTSIAYTGRLGEISAVRSVGRKGDSYDNAAAESLNSLYKKELIEREGPWRGVSDVMLATLEWVSWYNTERLHSACGYVPPKEFEEGYYARQESMVSLSHTANEGL
jgi:putative transposase